MADHSDVFVMPVLPSYDRPACRVWADRWPGARLVPTPKLLREAGLGGPVPIVWACRHATENPGARWYYYPGRRIPTESGYWCVQAMLEALPVRRLDVVAWEPARGVPLMLSARLLRRVWGACEEAWRLVQPDNGTDAFDDWWRKFRPLLPPRTVGRVTAGRVARGEVLRGMWGLEPDGHADVHWRARTRSAVSKLRRLGSA